MRNTFLEAVILQRAEEQCANVVITSKATRRESRESTRTPVYRETGPRKPETAKRATSRAWARAQAKSLVDAWVAMEVGELDKARVAAARLSPGMLARLKLRWVRHSDRRWPL